MNTLSTTDCTFCRIRDHEIEGHMVLDQPHAVAFLDSHPLFLGHVLLIPRDHHRNIFELPTDEVGRLFETAQQIANAVKAALGCHGIFIASNNGVSQSVDHLHIHIVPRHKKDGLRGFMWPRRKYADSDEAASYAAKIREELDR